MIRGVCSLHKESSGLFFFFHKEDILIVHQQILSPRSFYVDTIRVDT